MKIPKRAILAASLDPITFGHIWIVKEAIKIFDEVVVGVGINPAKSSKYMFTDDERVNMAEESLPEFVQICNIKKMEMVFLVDFAKENNATHIVRGIRNFNDFGFEQTLNNVNKRMEPDLTTIFLMPPTDLAEISSSFVKSLIGYNGWQTEIRKYVPELVARAIERKVAK